LVLAHARTSAFRERTIAIIPPKMIRLTLILVAIGLQFLEPVRSQTKDTINWRRESMYELYLRHSPIEYLEILKTDFKRKDKLNIFGVVPSPDNWVKEENIPALLKLIYSTDSTKIIMSVLSSYLPVDKFSSIGREAQNLIECFRTKKSYPMVLNSFGPPDKIKGKELEDWWCKYKFGKL
jgi:hypothetical protein